MATEEKATATEADRTNWWLLPAPSGNSTTFCFVNGNGYADNNTAANTYIRVPVCFRITG